MSSMSKNGKLVEDSENSYEQLKVITDAAQAELLKPWGQEVAKLLNSYDINVDGRNDIKAEITISFPNSTKNESIAVGIRYLKSNGSWAEDMFLFEKGFGLTKLYKGAQEQLLPEYKGTHHGPPTHTLQETLPGIVNDIERLKGHLGEKDIFSDLDMNLVVSESEHHRILQQIQNELNEIGKSLIGRGVNPEAVSYKVKPQFDARRAVQMERWSKTQRIYELKIEQINKLYRDDVECKVLLARLNKLFGK